MKNIVLKVMLSIMICVLFVVLIFGGIIISNSKAVYKDEMESKLLYCAEGYAYQFSREFENQESNVNNIASMASTIFNTQEYANYRDVFKDREAILDKVMKDIAQNDEDVVSIYFTFNPDTSMGNDEIWYVRKNGKVKFKVADIEGNVWLSEDRDQDSYYFDTIKAGSLWSDTSYDPEMKAECVTYSTAVYDKNNKLIGVAGADILVDDILTTVKNITTYKTGKALLVNQDINYLVGSLKKEAYLSLAKKNDFASQIKESDSAGIIGYHDGGNKFILAYAPVYNGWYLLMSQSEKEALSPFADIQFLFFVIGLLVIIASLFYAIYISKRQMEPIIKEFEEKDLYIINQDRQAKLGEMVGNIAHQWKQPLNSMGIILTNMTDEMNEGELRKEEFEAYKSKMKEIMYNMSETIDDFTDFLKPNKKKILFQVKVEIQNMLKLMEHNLRMNSIKATINGEEVCINGLRNEFSQAIFNVITNAAEAISNDNGEQREIYITIQEEKRRGKGMAIIEIYNNGPQIQKAHLERIFHPYFTTKEEQHGTGLGLYMTREIIEKHMNGSIKIENDTGGVRCKIVIPTEG